MRIGTAVTGAALAVLLGAGPAYAAVSVTLACGDTSSDISLYEIDYGANTIRQHVVTKDGSPAAVDGKPYPDTTSPITVTDREIKWTTNSSVGTSFFALDRVAGTLEFRIPGQLGGPGREQCRRWPPAQTQQF